MTVRARSMLFLGLALMLTVSLAPAAWAHAVLQDSSPSRGGVVKKQPRLILFRFSEPVESSFGAVRVYDDKGRQVQTGAVLRPEGQRSIAVRPQPGLQKGSYTATFRVISADSHPVSGGFVFSIGKASALGQSVSQLTASGKTGEVTKIAFGVARATTYAAIALAIGGLVFLLVVWASALSSVAGSGATWLEASERFARRMRLLLLGALAVGTVSEAAQLVFQGANGAGTSFWSALDADVLREVIHTRFGTVHLLAGAVFAGALLLVGVRGGTPVLRPASVGATGLAPQRSLTSIELGALALLLGFLAVSSALAGHASTQDPSALLIPTDIAHVLAMSVWVGGLAMLVFALPVATRVLEATQRTRLLAAVLLRFSPLALASVAVLIGSGLVQTYVHVRSLDNLLHTSFGRAVLIKFCLLLGVLALGAYNRQRAVPRMRMLAETGQAPGAAGLGLRRSLRSEVALLAVVLGVTAALVSYAPATARPTGPFAATKTMGPVELQLTVDPARTGRNAMHLYLTNVRDGSQFTGTKQLTLRISLPAKDVGPIDVPTQKAGPGHYVAPGIDFVPGGDWDVNVTDRVSEFDEYGTTVEVPVR